MTHRDRTRWDERYSDPIASLKKGPSPLLMRHAPPAYPGCRALELACGLGHNALWLAEQGYQVDAFDISHTALRRAHAERRRRAVTGVHFVVADLDEFTLPQYAYNLVYVFRFLDRALFPAIRARVRPGGRVIYQTLNERHLDRNPNGTPDHVLQIGELAGYFPGWDVIEVDESGYMSAFVGRKPDGGER